jgi:hypothetical protein
MAKRKQARNYSLYDPTDPENVEFVGLGRQLKRLGARTGDVYEDDYGRRGVVE